MDDHKIIDAIRSRNTREALNSLYRYFPVIRKMIKTHGGTADQAADIFQEALIILCEKIWIKDFVLQSKLDTYLYGVCYYLWKNEQRKHRHETELTPDIDAEAEQDVRQHAEQESLFMMAEKAIAELGERCRELLRLFYYESWSMAKIAGHFGYSSENSAKNQKYKCLETARQHLQELKQTTN